MFTRVVVLFRHRNISVTPTTSTTPSLKQSPLPYSYSVRVSVPQVPQSTNFSTLSRKNAMLQCSDHRYQSTIDLFLWTRAKIYNYVRIESHSQTLTRSETASQASSVLELPSNIFHVFEMSFEAPDKMGQMPASKFSMPISPE